MIEEKTKPEVSWEAHQRLQDRYWTLDKKIRLLVRILVDKKIIGAEIAKSFEETATSKDILEWYLENEKAKSA